MLNLPPFKKWSEQERDIFSYSFCYLFSLTEKYICVLLYDISSDLSRGRQGKSFASLVWQPLNLCLGHAFVMLNERTTTLLKRMTNGFRSIIFYNLFKEYLLPIQKRMRDVNVYRNLNWFSFLFLRISWYCLFNEKLTCSEFFDWMIFFASLNNL